MGPLPDPGAADMKVLPALGINRSPFFPKINQRLVEKGLFWIAWWWPGRSLGLSIAMSLTIKWHNASNLSSLGTVISPIRRKPKKARQQAAQSITVSWRQGEEPHTDFIFLSRRGDMGSLSLFPWHFAASHLLIPRRIYSNRWSTNVKGLSAMWRNLTPARYTLIVLWVSPSSARWVAKRQHERSEAGTAWTPLSLQNLR